MKLFLQSTAAAFLFMSSLHAGSSVSSAHLEKIFKDAPTRTYSVVTKDLKFSDSGEGSRLGRHFGELSGSIVGPYIFDVTYMDNKGVSKHKLEIVTSWSILDENGVNYGQEIPQQYAPPLRISEYVTGIKLNSYPANNSHNSSTNKSSVNMNTNVDSEKSTVSSTPETPSTANASSGYTGSLADGDKFYAGEYLSDTYAVTLTSQQKIKIVVTSKGFIPVILTKKDGRYSTSAGSVHGKIIGETIEFEYTATKDSKFLTTVTCKNKDESGSYTVSFYINGKKLANPTAGSDTGNQEILVP